MRFLANENFPGDAVAVRRAAGHDVVWVRTERPGSGDEDVLARAVLEHRVLLTFDNDFGELAQRSALPAQRGVVLFRLPMPPAVKADEVLCRILAGRSDWAGHFAVVEPARVRMGPLPRTA